MKNGMNGAAAVLALALGFVMIVTGFVAEGPEVGTADWPADDTVTVAVEIGPKGFDPDEITLQKDRPARIVFTRTVENTCAKKIHIPEFGIEATALPLNESVAVEVHPKDNGTFTFACAMNMMKGSILVKSE